MTRIKFTNYFSPAQYGRGFKNSIGAFHSFRLWTVLPLAAFLMSVTLGISQAQMRSSEFRQALPGYTFQFPADFFSHEDYRIEWWYYTGNLEDGSGRPFGYQLTFFRVGLEGTKKIQNPSRWKIDNVYFAHMTVTDIEGNKFYPFERINRKGLNNAGAKTDRLLVWNEDWVLTRRGKAHRLRAVQNGVGLDLALVPVKDLVIHGEHGVSVKGKGEGNASHYFSYTRMNTTGKIILNDEVFKVTGTSWMDHEFSSNQLSEEQAGWDWFSLKLDNQVEIMLYQMRLKDGGIDPFSSGTLVLPDSQAKHLKLSEFSIAPQNQWTSEKTGITYPADWELILPEHQTRLRVIPDIPDQELSNLRSISGSYWEGSVTVRGTYEGRPVEGKGYVELVGYGKALEEALPE